MKKILTFGVISAIILTICCGSMPVSVYASSDISSKSACLLDFSSQEILFEKNSHSKVPIASMVKMMTVLLILEDIESGELKLDDMVTTSENASGMGGSQVFIDPFVEYSVEDLLKSVIIASANDSSVALAEHISGSETNFVKRMNKRANELSMNDTHYVNCTGLPAPEGYSSAYDCAIVLSELCKHDIYHNYSTIWMEDLVHPSGRKTGLTNTNRLIRYYNGCDGGKTGSTNEAGCCLSATAKRDDMRLVAVIVGAKDSQTRFNECSQLFNYGFANFENISLINIDEAIGQSSVVKGKIQQIDVYPSQECKVLIKKDEENPYKVDYDFSQSVKAPINAGDVVGKIIVSKNGVVTKEIDLISRDRVEKLGYVDTLKKITEKW